MEPQPKPQKQNEGGDVVRFFANWMRNPMKMGAVAQSSRAYCGMMVSHASTHLEGPILELGAGLGVVTRALLEEGVAPERITSIEYEPDFAKALAKRFPEVNVICGDGLDLDKTLGPVGEKYAAILFAIPIVTWSPAEKQALFAKFLERVHPEGNVTQLTYVIKPPVEPVPGVFTVRSTPRVWANVPPARVWIYEHAEGAPAPGRVAPGGATFA